MESASSSYPSENSVSFWLKGSAENSNDAAPLNLPPLNRNNFTKVPKVNPNAYSIALKPVLNSMWSPA